jgi:hypothetical protein
MSLNQIQLNNQLLAGLYSSVLIETNATIMPTQTHVKYLGKNEKCILVLISNESLPFLPDNELNFFTSVLSACKLSLADVAIVNVHSLNNPETITETIECRNVLLFGVEPLSIGLPIHFPYFQLQQFNKRTYLSAPPLSEVEADKAVKLNLWNSLKKLFSI